MRILFKAKDGGTESKVTGYWLFESKRFGSAVLLRFDEGFREAYHTHAFHAISWILKGHLEEHVQLPWMEDDVIHMKPSPFPIFTARNRFHMVKGVAPRTWALSFRGPWADKWKEYLPKEDKYISLTHGRKIVD